MEETQNRGNKNIDHALEIIPVLAQLRIFFFFINQSQMVAL